MAAISALEEYEEEVEVEVHELGDGGDKVSNISVTSLQLLLGVSLITYLFLLVLLLKFLILPCLPLS